MKHISPFLRLQKFPSGSRRILPPDAALCQAARPAHDLIYRVLVLGLVGCALTGCGGGAKTIDTPTLVRVLGGAGFRNLYVISNEAQLQKLARRFHRPELARDPLDSDTTLVRGYSNPLTTPLTAVRLPSAKMAGRRSQNDRPLLTGRLPPREERLLPQGYDVKLLSETQVCNVVLTSYNLSRDQSLTRRFRVAVTRLRQHC
ncbi:MAG: hypothetical protein V7644_1355 [Actinomycetota bacterium]|jgi:hypothetical protein